MDFTTQYRRKQRFILFSLKALPFKWYSPASSLDDSSFLLTFASIFFSYSNSHQRRIVMYYHDISRLLIFTVCVQRWFFFLFIHSLNCLILASQKNYMNPYKCFLRLSLGFHKDGVTSAIPTAVSTFYLQFRLCISSCLWRRNWRWRKTAMILSFSFILFISSPALPVVNVKLSGKCCAEIIAQNFTRKNAHERYNF